jgi:hypothetical protein
MNGAKRTTEPWVRERTKPSSPDILGAFRIGADRLHQQHIGVRVRRRPPFG